jgi:hypothetical protein
MKVARQFIAWNAFRKDPSRRVRFELVYWRVHRSKSQSVPSDPIIPFPNGTVSIYLHFQAVNCLAILHLVPPGQKPFLRPVHKIDSTSRNVFEDEYEDEDEYENEWEP